MSSTEHGEWYVAGAYPELRAQPPWVMEEMIAAQTTLPGRLAEVEQAAPQVAEALRDAVERGVPVVVTGMGTAGHAARATAQILNDAISESTDTAGIVEFRDASEQSALPRRGGLCLAISHGGMSKSTVAALRAADASGARTAVITASPGTPAARAAQTVLCTPIQDASYCHTVGYLSPMLGAMCIASSYRGESFPVAGVAAYLKSLDEIASAATRMGAALHGVRQVIAAGSLHDAVSARELSLKISEGARLPTCALGVEDVLHGYLAGHDDDSALVVFATSGPGDDSCVRTAGNLLRASQRIGLRAGAIVSERLSGAIEQSTVSAGSVVLPGADLPQCWASLLGSALALQYVTVGLVRARQVNPDLIRREEQPYREAIPLGDTKVSRG
ncbi:SIS domain-containing protein [Leekyejoonella antrihumi]|nr:SIS domain-containing protein [Leekyejoonella antrihumi]